MALQRISETSALDFSFGATSLICSAKTGVAGKKENARASPIDRKFMLLVILLGNNDFRKNESVNFNLDSDFGWLRVDFETLLTQ